MEENFQDFIVQAANKVFTRDDITPETRFKEDLNAKSLNIAYLMNAIEDEYDLDISYMDFKRCKTVGEVISYIEELAED